MVWLLRSESLHSVAVASITLINLSLRKKFSYSEFFPSAFSRIRTEYGDLQSKSPYSLQIGENADQKISEYGHYLCSLFHANAPFFLECKHVKIYIS